MDITGVARLGSARGRREPSPGDQKAVHLLGDPGQAGLMLGFPPALMKTAVARAARERHSVSPPPEGT